MSIYLSDLGGDRGEREKGVVVVVSGFPPKPNPNPVHWMEKVVSRSTMLMLSCIDTNNTLPYSFRTRRNFTLKANKVSATDLSLPPLKKKAADVSPLLKGSSIFLLGFKTSLKTNLGKLLADVLRYYYFDSDNLVEEAIGGASAAKSFRESDEKGFYESETEVLKQLSSMGRLVVCAGNGAVQNSTNLALLRHGISLWVDLPLDIVARDVTQDHSQFASFEISSTSGGGSYQEVVGELGALYNKCKDGFATADAIISLQKVASQLGYDNLDDITTEDMTLEAFVEIEKLTRVKKMLEDAARPF